MLPWAWANVQKKYIYSNKEEMTRWIVPEQILKGLGYSLSFWLDKSVQMMHFYSD